MRVLITGAAGFIGGHAADAFRRAGHEVTGLDLRAAPGVTAGDVRDGRALDGPLRGMDLVVHQAAKVGLGADVADLPDYASVNVYGTAVLLAAMARHGVGRLVLASSMVVYGEGAYDCAEHGRVRPGPRAVRDLERGRFEPRCPRCGAALDPAAIGEDAPPDPRNAYATTKLAQEHLAAGWARETGGTAVALRYHNVYGPRMPRDTPYAGVAAIFRSALERGAAPRVFEDGRQRRDFVHVRDVAEANLAAADLAAGPASSAREPGRLVAYNVASGVPHTVGEMAAALASERGGPDPVVTGGYRLGDVRHITASPERAREELGFRASIGFAEGMREFSTAPLG
ncbi:NAD-dependent epimerase/dehydratase family protein [Planomonospora venezuelensis]|uniref:dTDP-L-rhamnose 4-epimerase n=1 Tax=Planomonospora venezuelensis TaxID=1999 RepID=A0A841CZV9_PLAVE|nr:NAD-dependent epimerase/dehydratase family protein [Planomonospora venezuelensis]MBB5961658.1 dTDP-L-rhamnose 4-epimerase [Planomonospora venezuelensis]GIM98804.1 NAD-dependent dehydratase [Planomonospora venezuelensis]